MLNIFTIFWIILAVIIFFILSFISAPYGRYHRQGWGPTMQSKWGWLLMESPTVLLMGYFFIQSELQLLQIILFLLGQTHYIYRVCFYPFTLNVKNKQIPISIVTMAFVFNTINVNLNGRFLFQYASYSVDWLSDIRFIIGLILFITGYVINKHSDFVLQGLRKSGETGYKIPYGGFFQCISSPNYFGEIIEWTGWAIATWSLPALSFAIWTIANLAPRARNNHQWYRDNFTDYPKDRKALLPGIW